LRLDFLAAESVDFISCHVTKIIIERVTGFMTEKKTAFYAYPGTPTEMAQTIRAAVASFNVASATYNLDGWSGTTFLAFRSLTLFSQRFRTPPF
jgi:hypothetical protein